MTQGPTRGKRLETLRLQLGASQELVGELSGLTHSALSHAENDKVKWKSDGLWQCLRRAFSMTREELEDYLDGRMRIEKAMALARPHIEEAKAARAELSACDQAAREGLALAGYNDDEFSAPVLFFLQRRARQLGPKVSRRLLAEFAHVLRTEFVDVEGDQVSHKSESDRSPNDS